MVIMVKSNAITISPETDTRFRKCISKAGCWKRGQRKKYADEAINDWCEKIENRKQPEIKHEPVTKEMQAVHDDYDKHHPSSKYHKVVD